MKLDALDFWRPQIEAALRHGHDTHKFDDIVAMVLTERVEMVHNATSFAVIELVVYPRCRVCHVFLAGGDLKGLLELYPGVAERYSSLKDCSYMSFTGRKGFLRALKDEGWHEAHVTMIKEI
jgi:hypothetical protein